TWNMWTIWIRNTILVQILLFLSIAVALMFPHVVERVFKAVAGASAAGSSWALVLGLLLLTISVAGTAANLYDPKTKRWTLPFGRERWILPVGQGRSQGLLVGPLLVASFRVPA